MSQFDEEDFIDNQMREPIKNGADVVLSDIYTYTPDFSKTMEENLNVIVENMKMLIQDINPYTIKLELHTTPEMRNKVKTLTKSVLQIQEDANKLRTDELVPVGIDKDGEQIYKRKKTVS